MSSSRSPAVISGLCSTILNVFEPQQQLAQVVSDRQAIGYVALSRFEVTDAFTDAVVDAFRGRPHLVEDAPGFIRLDVLRPVDEPAQFWLLTYWIDEDAFRSWHRSHDRTLAHRGMPEGLRLVPGSFELSGFEHVTA